MSNNISKKLDELIKTYKHKLNHVNTEIRSCSVIIDNQEIKIYQLEKKRDLIEKTICIFKELKEEINHV